MIEKFRPVHLWISCNCAPYCPLQRINQHNEGQKQRLEEKRCQVRKQYAGAIEVADFARSLNVQVHWELANDARPGNWPRLKSSCFDMHSKRSRVMGAQSVSKLWMGNKLYM